MSQTAFLGPVPPETNPPINPQYYEPSRFVISNISLGQTTTITTSVDHNYVIGQTIRLIIPPTYGCVQLNEMQGYVISIPSANEVVTTINSAQNVNQFISNPSYGPTPPQILAIGDIQSGPINTSGRKNNLTYIPGSFINISPL